MPRRAKRKKVDLIDTFRKLAVERRWTIADSVSHPGQEWEFDLWLRLDEEGEVEGVTANSAESLLAVQAILDQLRLVYNKIDH